MDQNEQTSFDLDPTKNDFLFFEHRRSYISIFLIIGLLALMIWVSSIVLDPHWNPRNLHGRGAWIVALLVLMPIAVRAAILAITTGWIAELCYRTAVRSFDNKPDFVIGVSGVADLNPWAPRVILWHELNDIRRITRSPSLFSNGGTDCFLFVAAKPAAPSTKWWNVMPSSVNERRIAIRPSAVGMDDDGVLRLIRRYSGRTHITERTV